MQLGFFSVAGEALNFGFRRMGAIIRTAWLPVLLMMVLNVAVVFSLLSVIAGRAVTIGDTGSYAWAESAVIQYWSRGWARDSNAMLLIAGGGLIVQLILASKFMAPLIRLAGMGENPKGGVFTAPFGPDQLRFLVAGVGSFALFALLIAAPAAAGAHFAGAYVADALNQTVARFPDPESLHTIKLLPLKQSIVEQKASGFFDLAIPAVVAAPALLAIWAGIMLHFRASTDDERAGANVLLRALIAAIAVALFAGAILVGVAYLSEKQPATGAGAQFVFATVAALLFLYVSIRLFPYAGVAVNRRSLAFANTFHVSRRWNVLKLAGILVFVSGLLLAIHVFAINALFLDFFVPQIIGLLYSAVAVYTRLLNSGVTAEWVQPLFIWIWSAIKILVNLFWTFFSYGVLAGLFGRLYRDSERMGTVARADEPGEVCAI